MTSAVSLQNASGNSRRSVSLSANRQLSPEKKNRWKPPRKLTDATAT